MSNLFDHAPALLNPVYIPRTWSLGMYTQSRNVPRIPDSGVQIADSTVWESTFEVRLHNLPLDLGSTRIESGLDANCERVNC